MQRVGRSWDLPLDHWEDRSCPTRRGEQVPDLCTVSMEKRIREEQAWHLQVALQDLIFRFQDWLLTAEVTVASANSSLVSYANSKKELQRFEALQRQLSDKLLLLETLNRQYHRLVRGGSISPPLRSTVRGLNRRSDELQTRAAAVYKRLKHFVNQREEFELERETIQVWLMELDLRLTDVEHFSGGTSLDKMIQLQAFQQDVQANAERVDCLLVRGESLIQKSQPEDAEILGEALQDLSCFCQEVFRRVFRFRWRLVSMRLVFEDEWLSDRESDLESDCFTEESLALDPVYAGTARRPFSPLCQSSPKKAPFLCRKQPAPIVGGTMDLEWDPSVDVGGSTSHDEEDSSYYSAITGVGQWEEPRRRCKSSSGWVSRSLPLRYGIQEDFCAQNGFQREWEQSNCSGIDQKIKRCSSGNSHPWELEHCADPLAEKGSCRLIEPMGFDPKRVETWLGQNCREKTGAEPEPEQGTHIPQPAMERQLQVKSQAGRQRAKREKPPQRTKKKARPTLITQPGLANNWEISTTKQPGSPSAEIAITTENGYDPPQPSVSSAGSQKLPGSPALRNRLLLLLFAAVLMLWFLLCSPNSLSEPSCLRMNGYARSSHLMLKYSGPPPT
ncbi:nesprin-4 [Elgaria multicarinata webbii]|uniref:nesprin-4 n=1 Tax=Elgaria multicarinata webbii TaxID=159646 RepID=UPI002FCCFB94